MGRQSRGGQSLPINALANQLVGDQVEGRFGTHFGPVQSRTKFSDDEEDVRFVEEARAKRLAEEEREEAEAKKAAEEAEAAFVAAEEERAEAEANKVRFNAASGPGLHVPTSHPPSLHLLRTE